jgi:peptidoglycan/xylan/chitin deacetylase (PgdA/CDA1 family)
MITKDYAVLSVDFELFSDTFAFQKLHGECTYEENGEKGVEKLLELFKRYNVKSTFFVTARHAKSHKQLLRRIKDDGHEIGSHSVTHQPFSNLTIGEISSEISDSKKMLEDEVGEAIAGFRAPAFRVNDRIMEAIEHSGYKYDSSVVPCWSIPGWYGFGNAPKHPFKVKHIFANIDSDLVEFPIAVSPFRAPISGAWMRLLGIQHAIWGIKSLLKCKFCPVLYFHPWEVVSLPRLKGIPWRVYYRTGEQALGMIERITKNVDAEFVSIRELLDKCDVGTW